MNPVRMYLEKLGLLDQYLTNLLTNLADRFHRQYPPAKTASQFDANVSAFLKQLLPSATQPTRALVRSFLAFDQIAREQGIAANMGPGVRDPYEQLKKNDPKQARAFLLQEMMASLKLMGEILSNVSKTRSEISMTFARNARA